MDNPSTFWIDMEEIAAMAVEDSKPAIRTFASGATRDTDENKFDYEGFISPLVELAFAQYMHRNRTQKDGSTRASDNWQKGIPTGQYIKSAHRHWQDIRLHHDGYSQLAREDLKTALCAMKFNIDGMLFELMKGEIDGTV